MGSYVQSNLISGEQIVYETKLHWIIYFGWESIITLFIWGIIQSKSSEFVITNKRLIVKVGLISRRTIELNLSKVESLKIDQNLLGRILGYGTIVVIGTGGTKEPFSYISDPLKFRKKFQEIQA